MSIDHSQRIQDIKSRAEKALEQFSAQFADAARERSRRLEEAVALVKESLITTQEAIREVRALSRDIADLLSQLDASLARERALGEAAATYRSAVEQMNAAMKDGLNVHGALANLAGADDMLSAALQGETK